MSEDVDSQSSDGVEGCEEMEACRGTEAVYGFVPCHHHEGLRGSGWVIFRVTFVNTLVETLGFWVNCCRGGQKKYFALYGLNMWVGD